MNKRIFALITGAVFLLVIACGVPQPTPSSGGSGGAEQAEDKILSEDEIEAEMNDELGDTDADEEGAVEEPTEQGQGEAEVVEETEETPEE